MVGWASQQAQPERWRHGGEAELFFDDTQIEVDGRQFAGARMNDEGNRALSWQTLWYGPWLLDGLLDGSGKVSEHLPVLLAQAPAGRRSATPEVCGGALEAAWGFDAALCVPGLSGRGTGPPAGGI